LNLENNNRSTLFATTKRFISLRSLTDYENADLRHAGMDGGI